MDAYERNWRRVALSQNWTRIAERNALLRFRAELNLLYAEQDRKRRERDKQIRAMSQHINGLEPVDDWVGAAWLSPEGDLYPVLYGNHSERAVHIARHVFPREATAFVEKHEYSPGDDWLAQRGWLRIGTDGKVTDDMWNREKHNTDAQYEVLHDMRSRCRAGYGKSVLADYQVQEFLDGLTLSLKYCDGLIDSWDRPVRQHEHASILA